RLGGPLNPDALQPARRASGVAGPPWRAQSAAADMVIYADGTTAAAPLADDLRASGIDCEVIGDAGEVGYIHGAIHSAWKVAATG
ncbi:hypothetical protein J8J23_20825, partial [Mycobacterium tuberculosis]|uniref:hypothetical protein n=1 Tax=Mycobacterium tuberculosis TaxID=1773 RepID=UPI001ADFF059